jgi:hypothetical protein
MDEREVVGYRVRIDGQWIVVHPTDIEIIRGRSPQDAGLVEVLREARDWIDDMGDFMARPMGLLARIDAALARFPEPDERALDTPLGARQRAQTQRDVADILKFGSPQGVDRPEQPEPDVLGGQPPAEPGERDERRP